METILFVDDEQVIREMMKDSLEASGFKVFTAENGRAALGVLYEEKVSLVVSDLNMPVMNGLILAKEMGNKFPQIPLIIITGYGDIDTAVKALKQGAMDFIPKPVEYSIILECIQRNLEKSRLFREKINLTNHIHGQVVYTLPVKKYTSIEALTSVLASLAHQNGYIEGSYLSSTKTVFHEALTNAVYHGALGIQSKGIRDQENGGKLFMDEIKRRVALYEYKDKFVIVTITFDKKQMVVVIEDGGQGFDWKTKLLEANDPMSFLRPYGRGLMLMKGLLGNDCYLNSAGDVVTLKFKRGTKI
jgi:FixJ family two-component response regulator